MVSWAGRAPDPERGTAHPVLVANPCPKLRVRGPLLVEMSGVVLVRTRRPLKLPAITGPPSATAGDATAMRRRLVAATAPPARVAARRRIMSRSRVCVAGA